MRPGEIRPIVICVFRDSDRVFVAEYDDIVLVYEADFVDPRLYKVESVRCQEDDSSEFAATWKPMDNFRTGKSPLYPTGILDLLDKPTHSHPHRTTGHDSARGGAPAPSARASGACHDAG